MHKLNLAFSITLALIMLFMMGFVVASPRQRVSANQIPESHPNLIPIASTTWEEEANARIEKIRKGDIEVTVKDNEGKPVPQVKVYIEQQSHGFRFGTTIEDITLARYKQDPAIIQPYQKSITDYFNSAVNANALVWFFTELSEGKTNYSTADYWLDWCEKNGIRLRGHTLFWEWEDQNTNKSFWPYYTGWVAKLDKDSLRKTVERRAKEVTYRYRGRITEWNVINELLTNNFFRSRLGDGIVADMFRWAKEGDPNAILYTNEFLWPPRDTISDNYVKLVKSLLDQGAPVGGIGIQAHFSDSNVRNNPPPTMTEWKAVLDKLAVFKLPMIISEYTYETELIEGTGSIKSSTPMQYPYNAQNEARKAQYLGDFYRLCFSYPTVSGILMWGHWDGAHWRPGSAILSYDFSPKPAADTYRNLVFNEWWTKTSGDTNSQGKFATRAYYGTYKVKVDTQGGVTQEKKINFPKGTQEPLLVAFTVNIPRTPISDKTQFSPGGLSCSERTANSGLNDISIVPLALMIGFLIIQQKVRRKP